MQSERHAYMILAHKNPSQLRTLLSLLDDSRNDIYVHIDKGAKFGPKNLESSCSKACLTFITPRISVTWGGVSIVRAEMALLEKAVEKEHCYYHMLSGMDLPIKTNDAICDFFAANDGKEFLDFWVMPEHTHKRVEYFTPFPEGNHFFLTSWLNHGFKALFPFRINKDVNFTIGSQWFSITDAFARYVVSKKDWVRKTFKHTGMCDEIFMATLLMMSPFRDNAFFGSKTENHEITTANMRYIQWGGSGSVRHPRTFDISDFDTLMSVPHLWARKFDETVDKTIIDRIVSSLK